MNRQRITTILTAIIVAVWLVSAVVRIFHPWPEASVIDSAMPMVIGFWFFTGTKKDNGEKATT